MSDVNVVSLDQDPNTLINADKLAQILGVSRHTVQMWRYKKSGPSYIRMGNGAKSPVRYRLGDVRSWIDSCHHNPTEA